MDRSKNNSPLKSMQLELSFSNLFTQSWRVYEIFILESV